MSRPRIALLEPAPLKLTLAIAALVLAVSAALASPALAETERPAPPEVNGGSAQSICTTMGTSPPPLTRHFSGVLALIIHVSRHTDLCRPCQPYFLG